MAKAATPRKTDTKKQKKTAADIRRKPASGSQSDAPTTPLSTVRDNIARSEKIAGRPGGCGEGKGDP